MLLLLRLFIIKNVFGLEKGKKNKNQNKNYRTHHQLSKNL